MPEPTISIVTPVYNGASLILRAIESLHRQTHSDWELLAVDDASTDASTALLEEATASDARIRVFRHRLNRGQSAARNTALDHARGEWIAYLDPNDEFYPDHLARAWEWRDKGDVLVFRYDQVIDAAAGPGFGSVVRYDPAARYDRMFTETIAAPLGVVHRRALLDRVGRFNEAMGRHPGEHEEGDLWRRFARAGATFTFVPAASGRSHARGDSPSQTRPARPDTPVVTGLPPAVSYEGRVESAPRESADGLPIPVGPNVALAPPQGTRPRVLFASYHCHFDPSSGATLSTRDLFHQLTARGWACAVATGPQLDNPNATPIGTVLATRPGLRRVDGRTGDLSFAVYDVPEDGFPATVFAPDPPAARRPPGPDEVRAFHDVVSRVAADFRPDVVLTYGGDPASTGVAAIGRRIGARVAFRLHNFAYSDTRAFAGCDAVIVPSEFSRSFHRSALGIECVVLPSVVDPNRVGADRPGGGKYVTFVNPEPAKGVFWFARIAEVLGRTRPDIPFLVVEGRGGSNWLDQCGIDLNGASIHLMSNTSDPRRFYRVTRVALVPSVWRESFGRVAVEAMLNGIPVIASDRGSLPEIVGTGRACLAIPAHITPETRVPPAAAEVGEWVSAIVRLWDDPAEYVRVSAAERTWHPGVVVPKWEKFLSEIAADL
ncbi:glycosyltransferase [Fimbriiglobus ruber]|uniref:Glycosyltransferase 2-like domain-containing protein n=1 Tax=Fimbriiglobus ruber TaxID=1908690 RepID=A0A225E060_9BACT|nr:glycosyltransferase [Fimbriiglobus ruber]OWK41747.1 hypothetical protein FRUB_03825 [Fimbriiglobus ruber]